jgi:hypothetical protein
MEEDLRKIHLENLLNTLEDSDKDKKIKICNIMKEMVKEETEKAKRNQDNDITHFSNKIKELLEKTKDRHSE